jgi:hypothetical protein
MSRIVKILTAFGLVVFLFSCHKTDSLKSTNFSDIKNLGYQNREGGFYEQVDSYLKGYKDTISAYQASKIDTLISNLSISNLIVIHLDDTVDLFVCDLATYKNPSVRQYSNTFYKACFTSENGKIIFGQYFTFYTDLPKKLLDEELGKIFTCESNSFTGVVATNSLNDQFFQEQVYSDGKLIETYAISPLNERGEREGGDCVTLWLVHTTLYSNGGVDREWELLGTFCNTCIPIGTHISTIGSDCDNSGGGGVGVGGGISISTIGETNAEGCFNYYLVLGDNSSCGVTMLHCWRGISVWGPSGYSYACQVDPATCNETYLNCAYLGKSVQRRSWPSSHNPSILRIADRSFRITWNYLLHYSYTFLDGSGVVTNYTTVRSTKLVRV